MKIDWLQRWENNDIGFHKEDLNVHLQNHFQKLYHKNPTHVLVPLCGKSLDMVWLAQQNCQVTGVEFSARAIEQFFKENQLDVQKNEDIWTSGMNTIIQRNFFNVSKNDVKDSIHAVYDRACLIAMSLEDRKKYVKHLTKLLEPKARILLLTLEYDQNETEGPPFSVLEEEVHLLYGNDFTIEKLDSKDRKPQANHYSQSLSWFKEKVYLITKK